MNLRKIRESKNRAEEINEDRIIHQKKITQNRDTEDRMRSNIHQVRTPEGEQSTYSKRY